MTNDIARLREQLASYCALHLVHDDGCAIVREALNLAERYAGQLSKENVAAWLLQTEAGRSLRGEIAKPWQERAERYRLENLAWYDSRTAFVQASVAWQDKALKAEQRVEELETYLADRCAHTCEDAPRYHEPNCPVADLCIALRGEERAE